MHNKTKLEADLSREEPRHRARIPGFNADHEVGLGDVIGRATTAAGIKPCASCRERAAQLNRWLLFTGRRAGR
jgi:hypothetical protein